MVIRHQPFLFSPRCPIGDRPQSFPAAKTQSNLPHQFALSPPLGGTGHVTRQQFIFQYGRWSYGGTLRRSRHGRGTRPLSPRDSVHIVFKVNRRALPRGLRHPSTFATLHRVNRHYARKFRVKIEMIAVERDHIHILAHATARSQFQAYFRVLAGQFAQNVTDTFRKRHKGPRIWKFRPFTRIVRGEKDRQTVRNYIRLNEAEATGQIPYQKNRLRDLTQLQIKRLWDTS